MADSTTKTTLAHKVYGGNDVDGSLSPIIFLHAMFCSKEVWDEIPQKVYEATKRRVYVYDAGNHGENEHSAEFSFDKNVEDLFQFMQEIKADKAILVGHSMGGVTAIRAALKEPSKVEKLISVEMYVKELPSDLIQRIITFVTEWKKAVVGLPEELTVGLDMQSVIAKSVEKLYEALPKDQQLEHEKESYKRAKFLYSKIGNKYNLKFNVSAIVQFLEKYEELEVTAFEELKKAGKQSDMPAYFIYAKNSHYEIQSEKESIKKYFPNAEFVEMDGAAHLIFVEKPSEFTEELVKCLQK